MVYQYEGYLHYYADLTLTVPCLYIILTRSAHIYGKDLYTIFVKVRRFVRKSVLHFGNNLIIIMETFPLLYIIGSCFVRIPYVVVCGHHSFPMFSADVKPVLLKFLLLYIYCRLVLQIVWQKACFHLSSIHVITIVFDLCR